MVAPCGGGLASLWWPHMRDKAQKPGLSLGWVDLRSVWRMWGTGGDLLPPLPALSILITLGLLPSSVLQAAAWVSLMGRSQIFPLHPSLQTPCKCIWFFSLASLRLPYLNK